MANLTGGWLAARSGVDPGRIERMRRAGELHAVRERGSSEWLYPSGQFEADGKTKPALARLLRAAHEQRLELLGAEIPLPRPRVERARGAAHPADRCDAVPDRRRPYGLSPHGAPRGGAAPAL